MLNKAAHKLKYSYISNQQYGKDYLNPVVN